MGDEKRVWSGLIRFSGPSGSAILNSMNDYEQNQQDYPQPEPPKKRHRKWPWIVGGVVTVLVIVGVAAGAGGDESTTAASDTPSSTAAAARATTPAFAGEGAAASPAGKPATGGSAPVAAPTPVTSVPAPVTESSPSLTSGQKQAISAAKTYLNSGVGFSRAGLIDQLTSQYGNQFDQADAESAVDSLAPDWNAQAVDAAENYLNSGMGFSRDMLVQQLTSPYGNQFTQAQAEYAANQVF